MNSPNLTLKLPSEQFELLIELVIAGLNQALFDPDGPTGQRYADLWDTLREAADRADQKYYRAVGDGYSLVETLDDAWEAVRRRYQAKKSV